MGLITQEVTIKLHSQLFKYFENKGYDVPKRKAIGHGYYEDGMCYDSSIPITVKVEDLPVGSHQIVEVECDFCHKKFTEEYRLFKKSIDKYGTCACIKCATNHTAQYYQNKYSENITTSFQIASVREKIKNTMISRYGTDNIASVPEIQEKRKLTCLEKYGVPHPSQNKEFIKRRNITNQKKYGGNAPTSSEEVKRKVAESFYIRNTKRTSKQQRYICDLYGGILNYPVSYFVTDIMLLDDKIVCEVDFSGHDLIVQLGEMSQEEFNQKEIIRAETIKREGYKQIHLISKTDKLPSDKILLKMLDISKQYFKEYPQHSWIEWYIDKGIYRNAENKDGVPYDYGELRLLKRQAS